MKKITVGDLPAAAVRHWNKYWSEYGEMSRNYETDINKVNFISIVAFSPNDIQATFKDKNGYENVFHFDTES